MSGRAPEPLGPLGRAVVDNVKRMRTERQMNYTQFAERLHEVGRPINAVGVRRMEAGERRIDVDDLDALAAAFGVPIEALMDQQAGERFRTQCLKWLLAEAEWNQGIRPIKQPFGGISISGTKTGKAV